MRLLGALPVIRVAGLALPTVALAARPKDSVRVPQERSFSDARPLGAETAWAGAFVVARSVCATLLVRRAGAARSTRVRIGFGVRCD
jgi:hypothetical protein